MRRTAAFYFAFHTVKQFLVEKVAEGAKKHHGERQFATHAINVSDCRTRDCRRVDIFTNLPTIHLYGVEMAQTPFLRSNDAVESCGLVEQVFGSVGLARWYAS
jgi:hypothetical protein